MKMFKLIMKYYEGDLVVADIDTDIFHAFDHPRLCLGSMRYVFELPTRTACENNPDLRWELRVSTRKSDDAIRVKMVEVYGGFWGTSYAFFKRNLQDTAWNRLSLYDITSSKLQELFEESGAKYLYVSIREI